jgi:branched-chain amino acid transport system ATP-binding protein
VARGDASVAENFVLAYGEGVACRGVSFKVAQGEIVALIGANGAGKSTTLRAVAAVLAPRVGSTHCSNDAVR